MCNGINKVNRMVSILCRARLLFGVCYNVNVQFISKSDQYIALWLAKFELGCLLLIFVTFTLFQNSRSLAKPRTLNDGVSKLISKGEKSKICTTSI